MKKTTKWRLTEDEVVQAIQLYILDKEDLDQVTEAHEIAVKVFPWKLGDAVGYWADASLEEEDYEN